MSSTVTGLGLPGVQASFKASVDKASTSSIGITSFNDIVMPTWNDDPAADVPDVAASFPETGSDFPDIAGDIPDLPEIPDIPKL